jgi:hypothetical protein
MKESEALLLSRVNDSNCSRYLILINIKNQIQINGQSGPITAFWAVT